MGIGVVRGRISPWRTLVPAVCAIAGFGFAASAHVAQGTDLRSSQTDQVAGLVGLVQAAEGQVSTQTTTAAGLAQQVEAATSGAATSDTAVAAAQAVVDPLLAPAGLSAVSGPGVLVVLDDAHIVGSTAGLDLNQLVVHQSDLQAVVNALWSGGAEAISIAGQRLIPTSAVRCVGNTLLLNGQVFSPPFQVAAIGPAGTMHHALDLSPGVMEFRQAAKFYGLGFTVSAQHIELPAYQGAIGLAFARAG